MRTKPSLENANEDLENNDSKVLSRRRLKLCEFSINFLHSSICFIPSTYQVFLLSASTLPSTVTYDIKHAKYMVFGIFICILHLLRVYYEFTMSLTPSCLDSSVGRALQRYRRGHGFESRSGPNFFRL